MSSGPLEWCIEIAIIVAICIGIVAGGHGRLVVPHHRVQRAQAHRAACVQRPSNPFSIDDLWRAGPPV
jgi:hypothetical protein